MRKSIIIHDVIIAGEIVEWNEIAEHNNLPIMESQSIHLSITNNEAYKAFILRSGLLNQLQEWIRER